jgi:hypothetical protein
MSGRKENTGTKELRLQIWPADHPSICVPPHIHLPRPMHVGDGASNRPVTCKRVRGSLPEHAIGPSSDDILGQRPNTTATATSSRQWRERKAEGARKKQIALNDTGEYPMREPE